MEVAIVQTSRLSSKKSFYQFHGAEINDKYTDFTISYAVKLNGKSFVTKEIKAHRIILANHSDFFKAAFDNAHFRESTNARLDLQFQDPRNALPLIFKYMYLGEIDVSPYNIVPIIHFADVLLCEELSTMTQNAFMEMMSAFKKRYSPTNDSDKSMAHMCKVDLVLAMLSDALIFDKSKMVSEIIDLLASRFDELSVTTDLSFISYSEFYALVGHPSIMLDSEFKLYLMIVKYIHQKNGSHNAYLMSKDSKCLLGSSTTRGSSYSSLFSGESESHHPVDPSERLSISQISDLYTNVNWEKLSTEELEEAVFSGLVPEQVLIKGLLASLKSARGHSIKSVLRSTRKARDENTHEFIFESHFDKNGIIYFLGCEHGKSESFVNPQESSLVACTMSSILVGNAKNLTSRIHTATCTRNEVGARIILDLGASMDIKVSAYTLMHGSSADKFNLRSWVLEGSNDSISWEPIISHHQDETLGGNFRYGTWFLDAAASSHELFSHKAGQIEQPGSQKFWRFLQVRAIGRYFVQLAGFEFYGIVRSEQAMF